MVQKTQKYPKTQIRGGGGVLPLMFCIFYYLKCTCSSLAFFCAVLQFFALVFCFGDQVLSPGSGLATDFLGVVSLWRVAKRKFF